MRTITAAIVKAPRSAVIATSGPASLPVLGSCVSGVVVTAGRGLVVVVAGLAVVAVDG